MCQGERTNSPPTLRFQEFVPLFLIHSDVRFTCPFFRHIATIAGKDAIKNLFFNLPRKISLKILTSGAICNIGKERRFEMVRNNVGAAGSSAELAEVPSPAQFGAETRIGKIRNNFCMEAKWNTKLKQ